MSLMSSPFSKRALPTLSVFAVLLSSPILCADSNTIDAGLYQIKTTIKSSSMPMPQQDFSTTQCISEEDVKQGPERLIPNRDGEGGPCQVVDYNMADGEISVNMNCSERGARMQMSALGSYTSSSYTINTTAKMDAAGFTIEVASLVEANRVGDCEG